MAKSVNTRYTLQTERAVQNLSKLSASVREYNTNVKATIKTQGVLNTQAEALKANLRGVNASATRLVTTFKNSTVEVRNAVRELKRFNKETDEAKRKTSELNAQFKQDKKVARAHLRSQLARADVEEKLAIRNEERELKRREATDRKIARAHLRSQLARIDAEEKIAVQSADRAEKRRANELQAQFRRDKAVAKDHLRSELAKQKTSEQSAAKDIQRAQQRDRVIAQNYLRGELRKFDQEARIRQKNEGLIARDHVRSEQRRVSDAQRRDRIIAQNHLREELKKFDKAARLQRQQDAAIIRSSQRRDKQIASAHLRDHLKNLESQATRTQKAVHGLNLTMFELRVAVGIGIARVVGTFINLLSDATRTAYELSKAIAEVQTVSLEYQDGVLRSAKGVQEWNLELSALSRNFGIPVLETTEALYEALSNQVVTAGQSTNFMAQQMKLAITTVSTLDEAVDATSTVINAFNKDVSETARINAVLFRAVDLGRFRLSELGSQFGRVSVLSNELKISFEEQAGAIALLTRLGLNADVAQTLLTNVQLKLVKPTEAMVELFNEWGVSSGEAAIRTFGFTGVLRRLAIQAQASNDPMSELGEIFQDLRAITGAQGLVSNFEKLEQTINDVGNATEYYNKAFDLSLDAVGRKADIELEKLRQQLIVQVGDPLLRLFLQVSETSGGADRAVSNLIKTLLFASNTYISYRLAVVAVNTATVLYNGLIVKSTAVTAANAAAVQSSRAALLGLASAQSIATGGLTILIAVIGQAVIEANTLAAQFEATLSVLRSNLIEQSRIALERYQQTLADTAETQLRFNQTVFRDYFKLVASIRAENTKLTVDFDKKFKAIKKSMVEGLDVSADIISDRLKELTKSAEDARKVVADFKESAVSKRLEEDDKRFAFDLKGKSEEDAIAAVIAKKREFEIAAIEALRKGEFDLADELFKRVDTFAEDAESRLRDLVKATKDAATEVRAHFDTAGGVGLSVREGARRATVARRGARPPRRGRGVGPAVAGVDVKVEVVDLDKVAALEKTILALEEERRIKAEERLDIERGIAVAKEKEAKRLEDEVKSREKAFETFKKFTAEIDAFDPAKGADALGALIGGAERAGAAAGLTPAEQLQFLRQAYAQRILIARDAATKEALTKLEIEEKALKEGTRLVEEAVKERQAAANREAEQLEAFANQNIEAAARLANEFKRGGLFGTGQIIPLAPGDKATEDARNAQIKKTQEAVDKFEALNNKLLDARRNGAPVAEILRDIASAQAELVTALNNLDKAGGLTRVGFGPGGAGVKRNAAGEILFEKVPGRPEESLVGLLRQSQEAMKKLVATSTEAKASLDKLKSVEDLMRRLKEESAKIPIEIRNMGNAAEEEGKKTITAQEAVQRVLAGTLANLEAIRREHERIEELRRAEAAAIEAAGPVIPRAHGGFVGRGTDRHLVALSGRETIMNRMATRQYAPLLRALNGAAPQFRAQGGSTSNTYGDINIYPKSVTSDGMVMEVAQKLQRLDRRGLYSSKGKR